MVLSGRRIVVRSRGQHPQRPSRLENCLRLESFSGHAWQAVVICGWIGVTSAMASLVMISITSVQAPCAKPCLAPHVPLSSPPVGAGSSFIQKQSTFPPSWPVHFVPHSSQVCPSRCCCRTPMMFPTVYFSTFHRVRGATLMKKIVQAT